MAAAARGEDAFDEAKLVKELAESVGREAEYERVNEMKKRAVIDARIPL